jgi:hypothetical protein
MRKLVGSSMLVAYVSAVFVLSCTHAHRTGSAAPGVSSERAAANGCAGWTLDGYRIGMGRDEAAAVRAATSQISGQLQVVEPGKFSGVLVFDDRDKLQKWDVKYDVTDGETLRTETWKRFGNPTSDDSGHPVYLPPIEDERETIWHNTTCGSAIVLIDHTFAEQGTPLVHHVQGLLIPASTLKARADRKKSVLD